MDVYKIVKNVLEKKKNGEEKTYFPEEPCGSSSYPLPTCKRINLSI